jgi:hypothetical protein
MYTCNVNVTLNNRHAIFFNKKNNECLKTIGVGRFLGERIYVVSTILGFIPSF